jgi:hypothetical protein
MMRRAVLTTSILALIAIQSASGATNLFTGAGTSWDTGGDWSNGLPQLSDALLFNGTSFTNGPALTLDSSFTVQTLSVDTGTTAVTIDSSGSSSGTNTLTLGGGTNALGTADLIDLSSSTTGPVNIGTTSGLGTVNVALGASGNINIGNSSAVLTFGAN